MRRLILTNFQAPGDIVMLTAAVRDLHAAYPRRFQTDVRTSCPDLWRHNPYLTALDLEEKQTEVIRCHYPLIQQSNRRPLHFLHGFTEYLNEQLGLNFQPTLFKGDIHLSDDEKRAPSLVEEITGVKVPYWILVAGGKYDYTIKWWHTRRWQSVVDELRGRVLFVQVGEAHHYHPGLNGVIDLRSRTGLRDLIRLVYSAQGVLCPVTLLMHLAAAVEPAPDAPPSRPCVVVAGGRESPHWEAYPTHQFLHRVGTLPCCATGGCWRSRSVPLGDEDAHDRPEALCVNTVENLPRCMADIKTEEVVAKVELYLDGFRLPQLSPIQFSEIEPFLRRRTDWERGGANPPLTCNPPPTPGKHACQASPLNHEIKTYA